MTEYVLEVPVSGRISKRFLNFVDSLGNPISEHKRLHVQYLRKSERLIFFYRDVRDAKNESESQVSLTPFASDFYQNIAEKEMAQFKEKLSSFASKFNCAMALHTKGVADVKIEITHSLTSKLKVTIIGKSASADSVLRNFFAIVDC